RTRVAELHQQSVVHQSGAYGQCPFAARALYGGDRVVDQVGPHLVQLGRVGRNPRHRTVVVLHDLDLWTDLARQHQQCAVEEFVHIGDLVGRAVQLGVLLGGVDEVRDTGGG